jgi:hypothetical protein
MGAFFCLQTSVTTLRWRNCAKVATAQGSPSSASRIKSQQWYELT